MAFYATMKNKTKYKTTVVKKYSDGAPKIINFDPVPQFDKMPSFKEKSQKPQQEYKPLIYNIQTSCKQENFTDDFFPLTDFWIIPPFGGLQRLRDVRRQVFKMLQEIPVKQNKIKTTGKPEENIHEDLFDEFLEEKIRSF